MTKKKLKPLSLMSSLPKSKEILQYLRQYPQKNKLKDICKAFNINAEQLKLFKKQLIRLVQEKKLKKNSKAYMLYTHEISTAVVNIISRNKDGELIAEMRKGSKVIDNIIINNFTTTKKIVAGVGDQIIAEIYASYDDNENKQFYARIKKLLPKTNNKFLGVTDWNSKDWYVYPIDRKNPTSILLLTEQQKSNIFNGCLIEITLQGQKKYGFPLAKLEKILGDANNEKQISYMAIHSHELPYIFSDRALEETSKLTLPKFPNKDYLDWRDKFFVTIDPSDAKDHDDAVLAYPDTDKDNIGGYNISVAIADVSAFIKPNSEIDKEAFERGNSVYFPDNVVPMLPEKLSNNLCSLKENEDRPALCVTMKFNRNGNKISYKFQRIFMRSHAKLTYQEAQRFFDNPSLEKDNNLAIALNNLWKSYKLISKARDKRAPLDLDLPERKIILDEFGHITKVFIPDRLEAHKLIEEFMIQANISAAELLQTKEQKLLYRIHDKPSDTKTENLSIFLKNFNLKFDNEENIDTQQFNKLLKSPLATEQKHLMNQVILRSQSQAKYSTKNIGHFGLNLANYTHFTSPIRRYSDLIIHRAIIKTLELGKYPLEELQEKSLTEISDSLSYKERRAILAERETIDRLVACYLSDKANCHFHAYISGITSSGIFVTLDELGADGFIPLSSLKNDYYFYDEQHHCLIGEKKRQGYQLGDSVEVVLKEIQKISGSLLLHLITKPRKFDFAIQLRYHKIKHKNYKKRY